MENISPMENQSTKNGVSPQKHPKVKFINIPKLTECFFIKQNLEKNISDYFHDILDQQRKRFVARVPFFPPLIAPSLTKEGGGGFETRPEKIFSRQKKAPTQRQSFKELINNF